MLKATTFTALLQTATLTATETFLQAMASQLHTQPVASQLHVQPMVSQLLIRPVIHRTFLLMRPRNWNLRKEAPTLVFRYSATQSLKKPLTISTNLGNLEMVVLALFIMLPDGRVVAVKRLYENNYKRVGQFMNEIEIIARLRHKNLVTLYGCTSKRSQELILVYEYISNGTVADHLHGKRLELQLLTWPIRLNVAVQTADALAYLHASDVIHRDVKTTNILLDGNFQVKVADFGLSRLFPNHATHVSTCPQGTAGYVDPEYYKLFRLTEKSDVYSFGVVLMELISSKEAVDTNRHGMDVNLACLAVDRIQKNKEFHELVDPRLGFEEDYNVQETIKLVLELAFQCLQQEGDLRPSMVEAFLVLKGIQKRFSSQQKQVMVDVKDEDDLALLKNVPPPLSPETRVVISKGRR